MKGLLEQFDRETLRSPSIEATSQKLDSGEPRGQCRRRIMGLVLSLEEVQ